MKPIRQANLLEVNEFLVLDCIRERRRTTRGEVERDLGISRASVSRIVNRLRRTGEVVETAGSSPRGGRPSDILTFNYQSGSVIVADLGRRQCHVVVADLVGTITTDLVRPTQAASSPYETLRALVLEAREQADRRELPVSALVVGLPAILDPDTGAALFSPWDFGGADLVASLARDVHLPILVENEANLAALAQAWRGLGRGSATSRSSRSAQGSGGSYRREWTAHPRPQSRRGRGRLPRPRSRGPHPAGRPIDPDARGIRRRSRDRPAGPVAHGRG